MNKIVLAVTGASGSIYSRLIIERLLQIKDQWQELSVVMTNNAKVVWKTELPSINFDDYNVTLVDSKDFNAPFASGSGKYNIMIIAPCSMGTLGRIAAGVSDDLISRSADVILKERRRLICVARETPYNLIHLQNMEKITLAGGVICPATPSFYSVPKTIDEVALTVVDRVLDLAGLDINSFRWGNKN
ncbi:MAG: UbiX family flavin prenyltransferase [Ginsengibacter sp.]